METSPNSSAFPDPARGAQSSYNNQDPLSADSGISIRAYIATKAMQGLLSAVDVKDFESTDLVKASVRIADELIEQLNKEK